MKPGISTDEVADQRFNQFVYAYTLFAKNLIEAGVDRGTVKMASDKAWGSTGNEAAKSIKARMVAVDAPAAQRYSNSVLIPDGCARESRYWIPSDGIQIVSANS